MRADPRELAAVFTGGALGALARALLEDALPHAPGTWPWATFAVNVAGALLLGWAVTRLQERLPLSAYRRPFLGTGICGGLTTFSALPGRAAADARRRPRRAGGSATRRPASAPGAVAVALATNLVRRARVTP